MPEFIPRSFWDTGPDRRRFSRALVPSRVRGVVLHYPGDGGRTRAGLSASQVAVLLRSYQRYHRARRGWPDIGYCLAVDQAGRIYDAAGPRVAAHSATSAYPAANQERVGVLLVLGDNEAPSPAMRESVAWLREQLPAGGVPGWPALPGCHDINGHRQMPGASTRCPGDHTTAMIARGEFTASRTRPPQPAPSRLLLDGDFGEYTIKALQRALAGVGEDVGPVDGDFGKRTKTAYQRWLMRCGFYSGHLDGDFGCMSIEAEQRWLHSHDLYNEMPFDCARDGFVIYALQRALNLGRIS